MKPKWKKAAIAAAVAALAVYGYNVDPDTVATLLSYVGM